MAGTSPAHDEEKYRVGTGLLDWNVRYPARFGLDADIARVGKGP
jgi:hypothetical protein